MKNKAYDGEYTDCCWAVSSGNGAEVFFGGDSEALITVINGIKDISHIPWSFGEGWHRTSWLSRVGYLQLDRRTNLRDFIRARSRSIG